MSRKLWVTNMKIRLRRLKRSYKLHRNMKHVFLFFFPEIVLLVQKIIFLVQHSTGFFLVKIISWFIVTGFFFGKGIVPVFH